MASFDDKAALVKSTFTKSPSILVRHLDKTAEGRKLFRHCLKWFPMGECFIAGDYAAYVAGYINSLQSMDIYISCRCEGDAKRACEQLHSFMNSDCDYKFSFLVNLKRICWLSRRHYATKLFAAYQVNGFYNLIIFVADPVCTCPDEDIYLSMFAIASRLPNALARCVIYNFDKNNDTCSLIAFHSREDAIENAKRDFIIKKFYDKIATRQNSKDLRYIQFVKSCAEQIQHYNDVGDITDMCYKIPPIEALQLQNALPLPSSPPFQLYFQVKNECSNLAKSVINRWRFSDPDNSCNINTFSRLMVTWCRDI